MAETLIDSDMRVKGHLTSTSMTIPAGTVTNTAVASGALIEPTKLIHQHMFHWTSVRYQPTYTARSPVINIDNGAGTTIDHTILRHPKAITITEARIVYDTETAGTVAGANAKLGYTVAGAEIVAATAYTNSAAVGSTTAMTLVDATIAAGAPVIFRHTGIAATAAGEAHIEIDYQVDLEADEVYTTTVPIHIVQGDDADLAYVEVVCQTAPTGGNKAFTVDLKWGNQSTAFASALSAVITVDSSVADREVKVGTITTTDYADGDTLQLVITTSGTTGSQGRGCIVTVKGSEDPS